jgi:hypothetical protein
VTAVDRSLRGFRQTAREGAAAPAREGDREAASSGVARAAVVSSALSPLLLLAGWLIADAVQPARYSPVRQTVSVLAGHGGTDRWIMTAALVAVGCCHLVTVAGLGCLSPSARSVLGVAGLAALGVAACPEPAHGSTSPHLAWTALGAVALAVWPAFVGMSGRSGVLGRPVSAIATVVFLVLLGWLVAQTRHGTVLGLAERLSCGVQTCWPFVVVVAARRDALRRSRRTPEGFPARQA